MAEKQKCRNCGSTDLQRRNPSHSGFACQSCGFQVSEIEVLRHQLAAAQARTLRVCECAALVSGSLDHPCDNCGSLKGELVSTAWWKVTEDNARLRAIVDKRPEDITVKDILEEWLKVNGYDGLASDMECGCQLGDLVPCQEACDRCQPGYKGPNPNSEFDSLIYSSREAAAAAQEGEWCNS